MGLQEEELLKQHKDLCVQLNLEEEIANQSWENFLKIYKNFTLEGDITYWLGCAIFEACQSAETSTVDHSMVKGNCVNLTSLLRYSNLSFAQFFSTITKWIDMACLSLEFRKKIFHLKDTFGVAYNTFNEFHQIFTRIFHTPDPQELDQSKQHRNRKQKPINCTPSKIFEFVWDLFIIAKMDEPKDSTDLTKSYHLLYSCIDLAFKNAFMADRRDLLNRCFEGLPEDWSNPAFVLPTEAPCIIHILCKSDSMLSDALHNKTYEFKTSLQKLILKDILTCGSDNFTGLFEASVFESNLKNLTKYYELQLLSNGGFDERIFLAEYRRQLLEQQQQQLRRTVMSEPVDISAIDSPRLPPPGLQTPLTGRRLVGPRNGDVDAVAAANSLINLLNGKRPGPSDKLIQLFETCATNPTELIEKIVCEQGEMFISAYKQDNPDIQDIPHRLELASSLFYRFIENILMNEKTRSDISPLVIKEIFYKCTFCCALEIIIFVKDNHRGFPWILDALKIQAFDFVKVIELIVRSRDLLSRYIIIHLSRVEETVLETVAWKSDSVLWRLITTGIPKYFETVRPDQVSNNCPRRSLPSESPQNGNNTLSASEVFQSPVSNVSRQLFPVQAGQSVLQRTATAHIVITDSNGQSHRLIPIVDTEVQETPQSIKMETQPITTPNTTPLPPKKTGSLPIFFRKFYNLAFERLEHLCTHLTNQELKAKIWTIFEDSIINHTHLMKDRHLDQLLLCAVYVIAKVCNENIMFTNLIKWYRSQPQAESNIYRRVLLDSREGTDGQIENAKTSDLIFFYNTTYVNEMKVLATKFAAKNQQANVLLSPLPARKQTGSSKVQVVGNVFIQPMDSFNVNNNPNSSLCYYFNRSPSKELLNINRAINKSITPPTKRTSSMRKIQSLIEERKSQNS